MTPRRVLAHPGWLAVVALALLASVAVSAVLDAGLRVWSTNAGIRAGRVGPIGVTGAPLPGPAIVTVPARPVRAQPTPVQQEPAAPAPAAVPAAPASAPAAAAFGNAGAPATVSAARSTPSAPAAPEAPVAPPGLLTFVAPLVPPIRVAGERSLALRALVLRLQAETAYDAPLLRQAWSGRLQPHEVEAEQPAADTTTTTRSWASGWTPYRQAVTTSSPTTSTHPWSAHTWRAWR